MAGDFGTAGAEAEVKGVLVAGKHNTKRTEIAPKVEDDPDRGDAAIATEKDWSACIQFVKLRLDKLGVLNKLSTPLHFQKIACRIAGIKLDKPLTVARVRQIGELVMACSDTNIMDADLGVQDENK
jgi:hypothetical protein